MARQRPRAVTVSCLLGCLVAAGILVLTLLSDPAVPRWVLLVSCGEAIAAVVCMAGLWHMKKWGPVLIVVMCARHFSKMD